MQAMAALPREIAEKLDDIRALCETYAVKRLVLFGSAVQGTFDPKTSDVDFLVEFLPNPPGAGFKHPYFALGDALRDLLGREVDLVDPGSIRNPYFAEAVRRAQLAVYDAA
jgi:predicted nucleotidyltransferase